MARASFLLILFVNKMTGPSAQSRKTDAKALSRRHGISSAAGKQTKGSLVSIQYPKPLTGLRSLSRAGPAAKLIRVSRPSPNPAHCSLSIKFYWKKSKGPSLHLHYLWLLLCCDVKLSNIKPRVFSGFSQEMLAHLLSSLF